MKKNQTTKILLILTSVMTAIAVGLAVVIILLQSAEPASISLNGGLSFEENTTSWDDSSMAQNDDQSGIRIPGYGDLLFPANTDLVPLTLYNPKENDCSFVFELYLNNSGTPFYSTGKIPPGQAVEEIRTGGLAAGEYVLRMKILTFDQETGAPLNNAVVKTKLTVV